LVKGKKNSYLGFPRDDIHSSMELVEVSQDIIGNDFGPRLQVLGVGQEGEVNFLKDRGKELERIRAQVTLDNLGIKLFSERVRSRRLFHKVHRLSLQLSGKLDCGNEVFFGV
jgi:hypothetical protein